MIVAVVGNVLHYVTCSDICHAAAFMFASGMHQLTTLVTTLVVMLRAALLLLYTL